MSIQEKVRSIFLNESDTKVELPHLKQTEYLINGELLQWDKESQEIISPICVITKDGIKQNVIGSVPSLTEKEALLALDAAFKAFDSGRGEWPTMSTEKRIKCVETFISKMKEKRTDIVKYLMWEIGKTKADSEKEFDRTIDYMIETIQALKDLDRNSSRFIIEQGIVGMIRRAPLGVVLCMGPFNYPLNETFTTLIPALIMGNTILFKPPKLGLLFFKFLLETFRDSFPKGVINTVYGDGPKVVGPIMISGKVNVLAFIGSSKVGDILKKQHPSPHRLKSVLGLEAKNPAVILPDADIDLTVKECVLGSLSFNGQRCTALKIIFVHKKIADIFNKKFCEAVDQLKFGMPWDNEVSLTPLPEPNKVKYLNEYIDDAKKYGARIINNNGGISYGTFFFPAVMYPVNSNMKIYKEEQFGPIVPIVPFEDLNTPIENIIQSNYGQQISLFGKDSDQLSKLIDPLVNQVCRVNINSQCQRGPDSFPFTGRKDSAEGTLSISDALRVFSIRTLVASKLNDDNKKIITDIVRERKSNFLMTDFIL